MNYSSNNYRSQLCRFLAHKPTFLDLDRVTADATIAELKLPWQQFPETQHELLTLIRYHSQLVEMNQRFPLKKTKVNQGDCSRSQLLLEMQMEMETVYSRALRQFEQEKVSMTSFYCFDALAYIKGTWKQWKSVFPALKTIYHNPYGIVIKNGDYPVPTIDTDGFQLLSDSVDLLIDGDANEVFHPSVVNMLLDNVRLRVVTVRNKLPNCDSAAFNSVIQILAVLPRGVVVNYE